MYSKVKKAMRRAISGPASDPQLSICSALEAVYQGLVSRDLSRLKIDDVFYPVGSAANYGLLYIILRAAIEFPFEKVVELGAGQSSLLLDTLVRRELLHAEVRTFEHDEQWAARIAARVGHTVTRLPLRERSAGGVNFAGYDFRGVETGPIDFMIIDGPAARTFATRHARLGALDLVQSINRSRFVVVVDDAERAGERMLTDLLVPALEDLGTAPVTGQVVAHKRQFIVAGGDYVGAAYY